MPGKSKDTVESFLRTFPPQTRAIAMALRRTVRSAVPDLVEAVYPGWKLIGYRIASGKKSLYFGFIYPRQDCVLLGFEYGAMVPDPERILEGTG